MAKNPYRTETKNGEPIIGNFKLRNQSQTFTDSKGVINASSTKDLLNQVKSLMDSVKTREVRRTKLTAEETNERRATLIAAVEDNSGKAMHELIAAMQTEIKLTNDRLGFARKLLLTQELGQGDNSDIRLKENNVIVHQMLTSAQIHTTYVREKKFTPTEYNLTAKILIDLKELYSTTNDILDEIFDEMITATMVAEDRYWRQLALSVASVRNVVQYFSALTPKIFSRIKTQVSNHGYPVNMCVISNSIWDDIIGESTFNTAISPVHQYDLLETGMLGTLYGVEIFTDAFRDKTQKVLGEGELFMVSSPVNHGVLQIRGVEVLEPITGFNEGIAAKGWFMNKVESMSITNSKSISVGLKR